MNEQNELEYIKLKTRGSIIGLFKSFLIILEDLEDNENINAETFDKLRKRVLTQGNNTIRSLEEKIDNLRF